MFIKEEFKNWLLSKDSSAIVGRSNDVLDCPLGRYAREAKKVKQANIIPEVAFVYTTAWKEVKLPKWAVTFTSRIDSKNTSVTAKECLDILNRIKE